MENKQENLKNVIQLTREHETDTAIGQSLTEELKQFIQKLSHGFALAGIASIERFQGVPKGHGPRDFIPDANAVVVIGLPIADGLTDYHHFLEESAEVKEVEEYVDKDGVTQTWQPRKALRNHIERRNSHEIINIELQTLSMYTAIFLEKAGFKSVYIPTTYGQTFSWPSTLPSQRFGPFSHRHAAVAAGLGELGLNNLLVTPQYGPRNRFVSIITQAPLQADPLIDKPICLGEKCSLCITNCAGHAFGEIYDLTIGGHKNRQARINIANCRKGFADCYKKCITACPIGKKH